jgi:gliding motility-associated-like protein
LSKLKGMKRIFSILLFLLICTVVHATHNRAGQILYKHISGNTYEFTHIKFYYTLSPAWQQRNTLPVIWGDNTTSDIPRVDKETETLPDNYTKCVYRMQHTFPGPGIYSIVMSDPNRNVGVQNIPNSDNVVFSVTTVFRIDANTGHNNTPELLTYPIDKAALGQRFVHNPSAYDADGDSLSYELTVCTRERGIAIESYAYPEASKELYVDAVTGDLVWDAPVKVGAYNIAMKINEWRKGVKIGSITRDMQIEVIDSKNRPPELPELKDTCVVAGTLISIPVNATDPDNDKITLTATGGPFRVTAHKAGLTIDSEGSGFTNATFTWQTDSSHVRQQPYAVNFKAEDQNPEVKLVSFANYNITVIAPEVENLTAVAEKKDILLEWLPSVCPHASGYEIYRSIGRNDIDPGLCETGIPSGFGYEKVAALDGRTNTTYRDNNNGKGLSPGIEYCYRIVAGFPDGARSLPSDEACASLLAGTPPMILTHVKTVDDVSGEIDVAWLEKPVKDLIAGKPGPFEYRLFYTLDMNAGNWTQLATKSLGDTTYVHAPIDTKNQYPYYYRVELWDTGTNSIVDEDFEIASSLYPVLESSDKSAIITFGRYTPWVNSEYDIYRCTKTGTDICIPDMASENFVGRTNRETYTDGGLKNGQEYCYRIQSTGYRNIGGSAYSNLNWSHVTCVIPHDNVPPCAPELTGISHCAENRNQLDWSYSASPLACWDDVEKIRIYFSPDPAKYQYTGIDSVSRDIFTYSHKGTLIGCYYVTAVDSAGNQSQESNIVCMDECGEYRLPNVFTPNGDNINDVFKSYNPGGVTRVDMKIYNRWGKLVFKTGDPNINWDGRDIDSKRFAPTGVYYYTCDVYEERLTGSKIIPLSGFVHLYYGQDAQPYNPAPTVD